MAEANEPAPDNAEQGEVQIDYKAELEKQTAKNLKLEQAITRNSSELGELRKLKPLVDKILLDKLPKKEPADFFTDPTNAVDQQIESHPSIQKFNEEAEGFRQKSMLMQLKESHPDYREVAAEPGFNEWVQSSKIRTELFQRADQNYDFDSANELLSTWKERKGIATTAKAEQELKAKTEEDLKAAKVHTGSGVSGKKIYQKADLMKLRLRDPAAYQALNVAQLYAEKRVR